MKTIFHIIYTTVRTVTLLGVVMIGVQSVRAATITVTNTNDSGAGSLRQAIADASPGDTIDFAVPTPATITLTSGGLVVNKSLNISGPVAGRVSVDGNAAHRVFTISGSFAAITISNLTITNGTAPGFPDVDFPGGGITKWGDFGVYLTINNCTISGNSGGGIFNADAPLVINNSTISGNSGGGIYNDGYYHSHAGTVTINNSTISDNVGGGILQGVIFQFGGGVTVRNTILKASPIVNFSYLGTVTSLGYNMSDGDGGGFLTGPGDQINIAPMLGLLQDNGGPTFTHSLLCGSPAINAGDPNFTPPPDYDQRGPGFPRVVNGRLDIGAFEVQGTTNSFTAQVQAPINADGSSVFTVRRGVVPVRFTLSDCGGGQTCDLPPATIAVTRTAGGVIGGVNESVYSSQADTGTSFRILNCQYHYNLNSSALGAGTYRVDILIDGQVVGSAAFQLD